jgi:sulfoxide reductase catalytic subunit YedY
MADINIPGELPEGVPRNSERLIGRRAFVGLVLAGLAALFLGKELFPSLSGGTSGSAGTFRTNSVVPTPEFDPATWSLTVDGLFRKPKTFTYKDFLALPQVERTRDFYCVEGWGVTNVRWKGVTMRTLLERADIDPKATHLVFYSGDTVYDDSLTIEEALRDDTLLANELNGQPLAPDRGQPLRLVLPGNYGYKYVKWVVRVEAIAADHSGYWEDRGYPADGTIK